MQAAHGWARRRGRKIAEIALKLYVSLEKWNTENVDENCLNILIALIALSVCLVMCA